MSDIPRRFSISVPRTIANQWFIFLAILVFPAVVSAQGTGALQGVITDAETGEPLVGANVFLNETTFGAAADTEGRYQIRSIPPGSYMLVVSMIGYASVQEAVTIRAGSAQELDVALEVQPIALEGISVEGDRREWLRRLQRFERHFFGEVANAPYCELLNPEVLHFDIDPDDGALIARTEAPLEMVNEALGYRIEFHIDRVRIVGEEMRSDLYGQFYEMDPEDDRQAERWKEAREETYFGSFLHFARAVAEDRFLEEGFRVYLARDTYYDTPPVSGAGQPRPSGTRVESSSAITRPPWRSGEIIFEFSEPFLRVEYLWAPEPRNFVIRHRPRGLDVATQISWIELPNRWGVIDLQTGLAYASFAPALHGFWGWSERVPNLLPREYAPMLSDENEDES